MRLAYLQALTSEEQAFRAVNAFKDEYLLDFINIEELGARDKDVDERLLEQRIVHNIRDYDKPLGVAAYKTSKNMPRDILQELPPIDKLRKLRGS